MSKVVFLAVFCLSPLIAEDIFLTCQVTQIAAKTEAGKADGKLRKIQKFLEKEDSLKKYHGFKFVGKKSLNATTNKGGSVKLRNKSTFSLTAVSVNRAQRKNTVTVDVSTGGSSDRKSFIDRDYLILPAGELDKKSDLILAVSCPVFP